MKKLCINFSRYFFLVLFLGFFGSNTFFDHTHIYDGNIIVHSHPFKHDHNGKPLHNHSEAGYIQINLLNNYVAIFVFGISLILLIPVFFGEFIPKAITSFPAKTHRWSVLLRGPPAWSDI